MLDAYCKHMGTHLAKNTSAMLIVAEVGGKHVEGDSIRCPYHGWRYNSEGHVDDIPYHDGPAPSRPQFAPILLSTTWAAS